MAIVEGDVPQVPYSITGISAMWLSCTAVPSIARIGGITLSFTPVARQEETTRASVASSSSGSGQHDALDAGLGAAGTPGPPWSAPRA